jgi:hypothetical protein
LDEPKHWRDPENSDAALWLTGQAVALRELSWKLAQNAAPDETTLSQWQALGWLLSKLPDSYALDFANISASSFGVVQHDADTLAHRAAKEEFSQQWSRNLTSELAALDSEFFGTNVSKATLFRRAQRLVAALQSLTHFDQAATAKLAALRESARSPSQFVAAKFSQQLAEFRHSIAAGH